MAPYHSEGICGQIVGMHDTGASIHTIAQHLEVPPTTVHNTFCHYQEQGNLKSLPIPGQPPKLNDRDQRELSLVIHQNRQDALVSIKNMITSDVSINTLCKAIHELGKQ
ncbi:hypothetical protein O181_068652 [Austropuccinia psidii MF-1]|uniref:Paired domain-containing protein n=1 Tax=Austropuccinia psidii MF-1 TaxID=1389203 RepID=A0A9Q3EZQ8_9BASI|nr:hypothetical protein [Austropuccinia psidii MF-1]